ncbi:MAG: hypothetical protein IJD51_06120 [Clostridia bacterium]|nr:hypothetical protein [Clostridia bacterium]
MHRYTYTNFSLSETRLENIVDLFCAENGIEADKVRVNGYLGLRLADADSTVELAFHIRKKRLFIDISASHPDKHTAFLNFLAGHGAIGTGALPCSPKPIELTDENVDYLSAVFSLTERADFPLVYLSELRGTFGAYGFDVDADRLAKRLFGVAAVVTSRREDVVSRLNKSSRGRAPTNGRIIICYPDGNYNEIREFSTSSDARNAESFIVSEILAHLTSGAEQGRITFDKLLLMSCDRYTDGAVRTVVLDHTLKNQIATKDAQIANRDKRIEQLERQLDILRAPLRELPDTTSEEEARPGEFADFVASAIKEKFDRTPPDATRARAVGEILTLRHPVSDYEKRMLDDVRRAAEGKTIDLKALEKWNIVLDRSNKHFVFKYKNISLSFACTPSDYRCRDNELSRLKRAICVTEL